MLKPTRHLTQAEWLTYCKQFYYIMYVLVIALFGAVWYLNYTTLAETGEPYKLFDPNERVGLIIQYGVIIYTLASIPGALYWFKRSCAKIAKIEDEDLKYDTYFSYATLRMSVIASAMVLDLAAYMLLGAYTSMIWLTAIAAIAFVFTKPSAAKAEEELRVQDEDLKY